MTDDQRSSKESHFREEMIMRKALKITVLSIGAVLSLSTFAQDDAKNQQSEGPLTLISIETRAPSTYLADGDGYALYVLVKSEDSDGGQERMEALPCKADCREAWPPLTVDSAEETIKAKGVVDASMIGTTKLDDGSIQVTYNGYPLHYFRQDLNKPTGAGGRVAGQSVEAFGGVWYVLNPDTGEPVVSDTETAAGA